MRARVIGVGDALHIAIGVVDADRAPRRRAGRVVAHAERLEAAGHLARDVQQQHVRAAVVVQQLGALQGASRQGLGRSHTFTSAEHALYIKLRTLFGSAMQQRSHYAQLCTYRGAVPDPDTSRRHLAAQRRCAHLQDLLYGRDLAALEIARRFVVEDEQPVVEAVDALLVCMRSCCSQLYSCVSRYQL